MEDRLAAGHGLVLQWPVCDEQPGEFAGDRVAVAELELSGARSECHAHLEHVHRQFRPLWLAVHQAAREEL